MRDDMTIVKNQCKHQLHPINMVAEYSFGKVCEDHYNEFKNKQNDNDKKEMVFMEKCYRIAIDKFGLTHEISTTDCTEVEGIWDKVTIEMGE